MKRSTRLPNRHLIIALVHICNKQSKTIELLQLKRLAFTTAARAEQKSKTLTLADVIFLSQFEKGDCHKCSLVVHSLLSKIASSPSSDTNKGLSRVQLIKKLATVRSIVACSTTSVVYVFLFLCLLLQRLLSFSLPILSLSLCSRREHAAHTHIYIPMVRDLSLLSVSAYEHTHLAVNREESRRD